jgi:hypothetical protein
LSANVIRDERLRALFDYWQGKRGDREMPARGDIDPVEIPSLLPIVGLVDVLDGGARFRYRLMGTELAQMDGHDPTGRFLDEALPDGKYADYVIGLFREVAVERRPLYGESDFLGRDGVERQVRRLLMPLSDDGQVVDMIFGGQVSIAMGPGTGPPGSGMAGPFHEVVRERLE